MKCAFSFNGHHYLAPTKREAMRFLAMFEESDTPRRFKTNWRFKTVEKAPSYCEAMFFTKDGVKFRDFRNYIQDDSSK